MRQPLSERHALVTGGSRGIGASVAMALLSQGARVTLLGRERSRLEEAARGMPGDVAVVVADVADGAGVESACAEARSRAGDIDILVNNAGQAASASFARTDESLWQRMLDVNLKGAFHCTRAVLPAMLARDFGRIVNIASTAGLTGYAYCTAYCAAKHGLVGFTRALAREVASRNVTVNAVCPGFTDTDLVREAVRNIREKTGRDAAAVVESLTAHNPQGRLVQPAEVANAVLWLCLPGSESVTGQSIAVAGGEVT